MSILSKIKTGRAPRAQKVVIYAPEGFGKSTIASKFPDPLFLDVEESTSQMDVARLGREDLPTLGAVEQALAAIVKEKACQTVIIDTMDWLEAMALEAMFKDAGSDKIQGIEDFGYGKGYTILKEKITLLLARFDSVIQSGINVVLLAHSKVVKFEPPDGAGPYDRYELKLSKQVAPLIKEWADMLLFGNFRTQVKERDKNDAGAQYKGVGGKERVMYCVRAAAWDAKNRHEMKDAEKWDISVIEAAFKSVGAAWGNGSAAASPAASQATHGSGSPVLTSGANMKTQSTTVPVIEQKTTRESGASDAPGKSGAVVGHGPDTTPGSAGSADAAKPAENTPSPASASPFELPRSADPIPGIEQEEQPDDELAKVIGPQEEIANACLVKDKHITADQTYRSAPAAIRARILKNPQGFLNRCLALAGGKGAA